MSPLYPLTFQPRFKERVWGGRSLETIYGKPLPPNVPIGESWEIADRPGDESVVANGPLAGRTLRSLLEEQGREILGTAAPTDTGRFPLLCKILDAREKLSLQVHPPARVSHLGEPKTEMWYVAHADPGAELFVGLRSGVTRARFEEAIRGGTVASCVHRVAVKTGDAMFLPSGRVHAIGAGLVVFEIQQNSDTTFRVDDWGRVGLDGQPRELHVSQSLHSIDFDDLEPALVQSAPSTRDGFTVRPLVRSDLFSVDLFHAEVEAALHPQPGHLRVLACVSGRVHAKGGGVSQTLTAGDFCLLPGSVPDAAIEADSGARLLLVEAGR